MGVNLRSFVVLAILYAFAAAMDLWPSRRRGPPWLRSRIGLVEHSAWVWAIGLTMYVAVQWIFLVLDLFPHP